MDLVERRIGFLFATFLAFLALAAVKAGWLGVVKADTLKQAAATQQEAEVALPARRGTITDVRGTELAVSQPATTIAATPYLIDDPLRVSARLAGLLERPQPELLKALSRRDTGFVYLARKVPDRRAQKVRELEIEGLEFIPEYSRSYPREYVASQLLGTVGGDGQGLAGLEYALDAQLRGRAGERRLVKDALGEPVEMRDTERTEPGAEVRLTIDAPIQDRTEAVLAQVAEEWQPRGATALVMDPRDGSILALANWPRVDANVAADADEYARQNRAIQANYEPGSTFKAIVMAGALEDGKVEPETQFSLPPTIQVADREIRESHPRGWATMDASSIIKQSSNVGMVKVGALLGPKRFDHWVRRFGFGVPTGIDLPGEEGGIVLPLDQYSGSSMGNLPIGQGIAMTPMQMASAYAAIANGGILRAPHVVAEVDGRRTPPAKGQRVISRETARSLQHMLEGVLGPGGTATGAAIEGYQVAGKTGTAQKPDPDGGYSATDYVASFVGFAPASDPKLLVAVMVDEPKGEIYGGAIAAPAFREITSFALTYLRIPPR